MVSKSKSNLVKAYRTMNKLGYESKVVKPVLKNLLEVYDQNWELIQDEDYAVLVDAVLSSEESKSKENQRFRLMDEPEEDEPLPKKLRSSSQTDQTLTHSGVSSSSSDLKKDGPLNDGIDATSEGVDEGMLTSSSCFCVVDDDTEDGNDIPMQDSPQRECKESDPWSAQPQPDHAKSFITGNHSNAKENFSTSPEVIELDTNDTYLSSSAKGPLLLGYHLKPKSSVTDDESSQNGSHLDIASSCQGEVKLSVTFGSSLPSNFCVPSLDAVLKRMEEKYFETYNISGNDFSVVKLMTEICETFLARGMTCTGNERVSCTELQPASLTTRDSDGQDVSNNFGNAASFCIDPPRFPVLNALDLSQCKIGLPMKMSGSYCKEYLEGLRNQSSSTAQIMVVAQHSLPKMLESASLVDDITRGEENFKISLINEITDEHQPVFKYIPRNIAYRDAYVKFPLARISDDNCCSDCFGDCLMAALPCACADETGGEFAYLPGGLLKEKFLEETVLMKTNPQQKMLLYCQDCPLERSNDKSLSGACKGHLARKFIKECWYKCGCTMGCGNRVVQRGINCNLQVFMTKKKGWGLRTLEDLPKGAFVCEYVGEIVSNMELFERNSRSIGEKHTFPVLLDADWCTEGVLKDEEALCLDATLFGNVARFINHRCHDPNLVEIPVEVESQDHHYYHLAFFTTREVQASEELTWDYGINFNDHSHPVEAFRCHCESEFCRDLKRGGRK